MALRGLVLLLLPVLLAVGVGALLRSRRPALPADAPVDEALRALAAAQRRLARLSVVAAAVFAVAAVLLLGDSSVYVALPGAVAVLGAGRLLGERLAPAVPAGPRTAVLVRRERADYVQRGRVVLMRASAAAATAVGTGTALAAAPGGRAFEYVCSPVMSGGGGPWPGWPFVVPGLVVLLVSLLLAEATLRRVVARPRPSSAGAGLLDDGLRSASARAVVRSTTAVALLLVTGICLPAGAVLARACGSALHETTSWWLLALAAVAALALVVLAVDAGRAAVERPAARIARTPAGSTPR